MGSDRTHASNMRKNNYQRAVYVAGFVANQYQNTALWEIVADLVPYCYVTTNPSSSQSWTRTTSRHMLDAADALIFYMNEQTLSDKRCLLTLQAAWELMIPIVMLRHPRTKLLIQPNGKPKSDQRHPGEPDMDLLKDVLFETFKESLSYDRFQHNSGMRQLRLRLNGIFERARATSPLPSKNTPDLLNSPSANFRLPPISGILPTPRGKGAKLAGAAKTPLRGLERSHSYSSISDDSVLGDTNSGHESKTTKKSKKTRASKAAWAPKKTEASPVTKTGSQQEDNRAISAGDKKPYRNSVGSVTSLDDEALYHETKYLIFPIRDKTTKPRLVNFPTDVLEQKGEELVLESIWGSESSLEVEFERAEELRGDLDVHSPSPAPVPLAPYLGSL